MKKKTSLRGPSLLSVQSVVLAAAAWAVLALLFFLTFSVSAPGTERPEWYQKITYIMENMAFLGAGVLCFRNWRSSQIVSGGTVWLALGLGMFSYFIGNLLLAYWEVALGQEPEVSPGDLFFILTYIFLGWGMLRAVISRELNLTPLQWILLAIIAVGGVAIAIISATAPPDIAVLDTATELVPEVPTEAETVAPTWVAFVEEQLAPIAAPLKWLYIIGDVILVVMASTLLLAFWGGRFSLSWRFIALAAFSFYIADIWFNYATNYIPDYQTGALPEVFWIFSGCLFAIGAALEYDLSTRRQTRRRRS
ncbi:hypothetical protein [Leptolyngbya sp. 7M]|uniref:hypothetical protein n=1 Tax=Leptolyngbya sp. 7M TaxID=2812896 RepID=UPI001B8AAEF2|nr:hypothetical protein [Leptolyngbya sp. 7M]QYO67134.1 hypothetical protein JVX88_10175 [Leptolyngbya sp. 7M]